MPRAHTPVLKELRTIAASLRRLSVALERALPTTPKTIRDVQRRGTAGARAPRLAAKPPSPARRRAMRLQGRYISAVRLLSPRQKAQVRALRKEKGVQAAIALAVRLRD